MRDFVKTYGPIAFLGAALVSGFTIGALSPAHAGYCDFGACDLAPLNPPAYDDGAMTRESLDAQRRLEEQGEQQRQDLQTRMDLNALGLGVHRP